MSEDKSLQERIAELEQQTARAQAASAAAEAKARDAELRNAATDALGRLGVHPDRHRAVLAMIHSMDKRLIVNEETGRPAWATHPGQAWEAPVEIEDGLKDWLKTDEGKAAAQVGSAHGRRRAHTEEARETSIDAVMNNLLRGIIT